MAREPLKRLDKDKDLRSMLLPYCRLQPGQIWVDEVRGHKVGCGDTTNASFMQRLLVNELVDLSIQDPPYNLVVGSYNSVNLSKVKLERYLQFSKMWLNNLLPYMASQSHLYFWLGADIKNGFQPLPDIMLLLRQFDQLQSKNLITLRNQRGYGTQQNWMSVRQECLHYTIGKPSFNVDAVYTHLDKKTKGYNVEIDGVRQNITARSKSDKLRSGNVWVDVQQVFYKMYENVPGCYAQKPLKAIEKLVLTSSDEKDTVLDLFAHSGTTLLAAEKHNRTCITCDIDPIFAEITIRRLEHYRKTNQPGWQCNNPFPEVESVMNRKLV